MGDLNVANKYQQHNFHVQIDGNVTIKNFKGERALRDNEIKTVVKNGKISNFFKWTNKDHATLERALNLSTTNYTVFDKLRKADKSDKKGAKLTRSDLEAFRKDKKLQQELGVKVKYDAKEKVYGIYGADGSKLYFDFD